MENIKLTGSKNIRDLGGLPVQGGRVREKCFLRGGQLHDLTPKDIERLQRGYHIATIVDLRTVQERNEMPDAKIPGVRYIHAPIYDKFVAGITHEKQEQEEMQLADKIPDMAMLYRTMVSKESAGKLAKIVRSIVNLAPSQQPVLFHCTEGKDRTGIIAMILLSILGATRETIMEDYLFTNTINKEKAEGYYQQICLEKKDERLAEKVREAYLAKESYLNASFDAIDEIWGGMDAFLESGLGINKEMQKAFRRNQTVAL